MAAAVLTVAETAKSVTLEVKPPHRASSSASSSGLKCSPSAAAVNTYMLALGTIRVVKVVLCSTHVTNNSGVVVWLAFYSTNCNSRLTTDMPSV
eukprot:12300-Heterococcus_DN1.PRE.1